MRGAELGAEPDPTPPHYRYRAPVYWVLVPILVPHGGENGRHRGCGAPYLRESPEAVSRSGELVGRSGASIFTLSQARTSSSIYPTLDAPRRTRLGNFSAASRRAMCRCEYKTSPLS